MVKQEIQERGEGYIHCLLQRKLGKGICIGQKTETTPAKTNRDISHKAYYQKKRSGEWWNNIVKRIYPEDISRININGGHMQKNQVIRETPPLPPMKDPFVNKLKCNRMAQFGHNFLQGSAPDIDNINTHTQNYLTHLSKITGSLTNRTKPVIMN